MAEIYLSTKMKNYPSYQKQKAPQRVMLPMGSLVFINATHPTSKKNIYLCQARIVRQPRRRDDERYKVVITGVQTFGTETSQFLSAFIGMKIVRHSKGISTEKPLTYSYQESRWTALAETEAEQLARRTITNIKKDFIRQRKHQPIQRLD